MLSLQETNATLIFAGSDKGSLGYGITKSPPRLSLGQYREGSKDAHRLAFAWTELEAGLTFELKTGLETPILSEGSTSKPTLNLRRLWTLSTIKVDSKRQSPTATSKGSMHNQRFGFPMECKSSWDTVSARLSGTSLPRAQPCPCCPNCERVRIHIGQRTVMPLIFVMVAGFKPVSSP